MLYVSVIDRVTGHLKTEPISLNVIESKAPNGEIIRTDYFAKLKECENERRKNRQNWDVVRKIKELRDGYVGHCVKRIVDLAIEHKAIIVLENLNVGFKQGRSAIERSVYNQLEQALLKKLQYVVDKSVKPTEVFGSQNGVQLSPPDIAPKFVSNHMGFVFFVDPSYTSAVDPLTGYRQQFRLDSRVNTTNFQQFIKNGFEAIEYKDGQLLFRFSWRRLADARNKIGKKTEVLKEAGKLSDMSWQITTDVPRAVYHRKKDGTSETEIVNPGQKLLELFASNNIDIRGDIAAQLANMRPSAKFVETFIWCFNTTNHIRNTIDGQDTIISPVYPGGFNSLTMKYQGYTWNGDANGAYHIARKGAILLNKLYAANTPKEFDCKVSISEYDDVVTKSSTA